MPGYMSSNIHGPRKRASAVATFIWLIVILVPVTALFCAMAAAALATVAVGIVPGTAASMAGKILCPANTTATQLDAN